MNSNPFSTRFVRPGAIDYLFADDQSAERLVDRLSAAGWWGQIVGPHGSGKSTLVQSLLPVLAARGRNTILFAISSDQRKLDLAVAQLAAWDANTQVIVDGYEQLRWWTRWRLRRNCRQCGAGLLVTTHQNLGLPTLCETRGNFDTVQQIVAQLLQSQLDAPESVSPQISTLDMQAAFEQQQGNVRETLFALYDLYELRRIAKVPPTAKP